MSIQFEKQFGDYVTIDGGSSISARLPGGVVIRATVHPDNDTRPDDFDCYDDSTIDEWKRDEWQFCGIVISVFIDCHCVDESADSLWGIEANFRGNNSYLNECAAEMAGSLDVAAILDEHARKATRAAAEFCA
jgi:hypothetical protein